MVRVCAAGASSSGQAALTSDDAVQCQCGCTLTGSSGHMIVSARQPCQSAVRRWTIHADHTHQLITLTVNDYTLSSASTLRLYDAASARPLALLLQLPDDYRQGASKTVTTSGPRMVVEYTYTPVTDHTRTNDGFIASYVATDQLTGTSTSLPPVSVSLTW